MTVVQPTFSPKMLVVPFQINARGEVSSTANLVVMAAQEIKAALLTFQGEQLMRPQLGSPFATSVFSTMLSDDGDFLTHQLTAALTQQITLSSIQFVRVSPNSQPGTLQIEVAFMVIGADTVQQALTFDING